jgi:hypothetical protein
VSCTFISFSTAYTSFIYEFFILSPPLSLPVYRWIAINSWNVI